MSLRMYYLTEYKKKYSENHCVDDPELMYSLLLWLQRVSEYNYCGLNFHDENVAVEIDIDFMEYIMSTLSELENDGDTWEYIPPREAPNSGDWSIPRHLKAQLIAAGDDFKPSNLRAFFAEALRKSDKSNDFVRFEFL